MMTVKPLSTVSICHLSALLIPLFPFLCFLSFVLFFTYSSVDRSTEEGFCHHGSVQMQMDGEQGGVTG